MSALIDGAKKRLAQHGPDRVIIDGKGMAVSPFRAKTEFSVEADVVFIRADGWMLGAPWKLANYARSIWKGQWAEEVIINPDTRPKKADKSDPKDAQKLSPPPAPVSAKGPPGKPFPTKASTPKPAPAAPETKPPDETPKT